MAIDHFSICRPNLLKGVRIASDETVSDDSRKCQPSDRYGCVAWHPGLPSSETTESLSVKKTELIKIFQQDGPATSVIVSTVACSETVDLASVLLTLTNDIQGEPYSIVVNRRSVLRSVSIAMAKSDFSFQRPVFAGEDAEDEG